MLKERFGDPHQIICSHVEVLLQIPNCSSDLSSSLHLVYDKIIINIRGLQALGITSEQYGSLLIPVVITKFSDKVHFELLVRWGRMCGRSLHCSTCWRQKWKPEKSVKVLWSSLLLFSHLRLPSLPLAVHSCKLRYPKSALEHWQYHHLHKHSPNCQWHSCCNVWGSQYNRISE